MGAPADAAKSGKATAKAPGEEQASERLTANLYLVLDTAGGLLPDRRLPSGDSFSVGIEDPTLERGTLTVSLVEPGCHGGQTPWETIGLRKVPGGLVGTLGPLPSGRAVRLDLAAHREVSKSAWDAWADQEVARLKGEIEQEARSVVGAAPDPSACSADRLWQRLQTPPSDALPATLTVDGAVLQAELSAVVLPLAARCAELAEAYDEASALAGIVAPTAPALDAAGEGYLPAVLVAEKFVRLDQALIGASETERKAIATQLQSLSMVAGFEKPVRAWVAALRAPPLEGSAPRPLPALPKARPVVRTTSGAYVPWATLREDYSTVDPSTLEAQAAAVFPSTDALHLKVRAFAQAVVAYQVRPDAVRLATGEVTAITSQIEDLLESAYDGGASAAGQHLFLVGNATTAEPENPANTGSFFTPTFGAGPAVAFGGTSPDLWAVPFMGATVYFAPIDRALTLKQLDGMPFRKVGVTVGVTVYGPAMDVPNRDERGLLDKVTLLGGVSVRLSRLTNATVFGVPYKVAPPNPLDEPYRLSGAVGLAFGFEADVWSALTKLLPS